MPHASSPTRRRWFLRSAAIVTTAVTVVVFAAQPAMAEVAPLNARRSGAGLAPLAGHAGLASIARQHSMAMASQDRLHHSANLPGRVSSVLSDWQGVGENVGFGSSVAEVDAMFMDSSTHRANILGRFNLAGVGVAWAGDRVWVTQVFALVPTQATAASSAGNATVVTRPPASAPVRLLAERTTQTRSSRSGDRTVGDRTVQARTARAAPPAPDPVRAPTAPPATVGGVAYSRGGYQLIAEDGGVFTYGDAVFAGSAAEMGLTERVVGGAATPSGDGYYLFGERGGVFTFGDATFHGSAADTQLNAPIVGGAVTPSGDGYVLFAEDGGVLTFGDAIFVGSAAGQRLNAPIVGGAMAPGGYWLVGSDGGVFAFGEAEFLGAAAGIGPLGAPVVGMAATPTGRGYWLVGRDGGVFTFGDAEFAGSAADQPLPSPVYGIIVARSGRGYWLVRGDREAIPFGDLSAPVRRLTMGAPIRLI